MSLGSDWMCSCWKCVCSDGCKFIFACERHLYEKVNSDNNRLQTQFTKVCLVENSGLITVVAASRYRLGRVSVTCAGSRNCMWRPTAIGRNNRPAEINKIQSEIFTWIDAWNCSGRTVKERHRIRPGGHPSGGDETGLGNTGQTQCYRWLGTVRRRHLVVKNQRQSMNIKQITNHLCEPKIYPNSTSAIQIPQALSILPMHCTQNFLCPFPNLMRR